MELKEVEVKKRLIVALDLDSLSEARNLVKKLKDSVSLFKIGHQLFTRYGPTAIEMIREEGGQTFLDLKYHDIPNTVKKAIEAAVSLKIFMLNLHALGGKAMMKGACEAARATAKIMDTPAPLILAVTMLTSLLDTDLNDLGITPPVAEEVKRLAFLAYEAGLNGVVASPQEISIIRESFPQDFLIVTPGVRLENSDGDDQKRILTPREALKAGADYLVVGRPILQASDPVKATHNILEEMALALS